MNHTQLVGVLVGASVFGAVLSAAACNGSTQTAPESTPPAGTLAEYIFERTDSFQVAFVWTKGTPDGDTWRFGWQQSPNSIRFDRWTMDANYGSFETTSGLGPPLYVIASDAFGCEWSTIRPGPLKLRCDDTQVVGGLQGVGLEGMLVYSLRSSFVGTKSDERFNGIDAECFETDALSRICLDKETRVPLLIECWDSEGVRYHVEASDVRTPAGAPDPAALRATLDGRQTAEKSELGVPFPR